MDMEKCSLCDFVTCKRRGDLVTCGKAGIDKIIQCSAIRRDTAHEAFEGKSSVRLHSECRKVYTRRPKPPAVSKDDDPPRLSRPPPDIRFDFKVHCLFCKQPINVVHPERRPFSLVVTLESIDSIRQFAATREDRWAQEVLVRLENVSDLVAAEGRYHRDCYIYFQRKGSSLPHEISSHGRTYVAYLNQKYCAQKVVVFDGYDGSSTKDVTHLRRAQRGSSIQIEVHENNTANIGQDLFLANGDNKMGLIAVLTQKLTDAGVNVVQAPADADRLIVMTAIDIAETGEDTCIVGQDTDLAVLMTSLTPAHVNLKLLVPQHQKKPPKMYESKSCQEAAGNVFPNLLFLHAATGCDTTSALFNVGKVTPFKRLAKDVDLRKMVDVFNQHNASKAEITKAGELFISAQYPGKGKGLSLDERRFELYTKINARLPSHKKFDLAQLPPTSEAARQHSLRVYLQVQEWKGHLLPPTEWGYEEANGLLYPVTSTKLAAPAELLEMISCNCITGCVTNNCTCKKHRMYCSNLCGHCSGHGCSNSSGENFDDDPEGDLEEISPDDSQYNLEGIEPPMTIRRLI